MFILPILTLVAFTFLLPYITVLVNEQIPQLGYKLTELLSPPEPAPVVEDIKIDDKVEEVLFNGSLPPLPFQLLYNNPQTLGKDIHALVSETKDSIETQIALYYNDYAPNILKSQVVKLDEFWNSEEFAQVLIKYQKPISNLVMGLALLLAMRIFKFVYRKIAAKKYTIPVEALPAPKVTVSESDFETIPLCVGKGDAEELQLFNSYSEILQTSNDLEILRKYGVDSDSNSNLSVLDNFSPTRYASPSDYTAADISAMFQSRGGTPVTPIQQLDESLGDIKGVDSFSSSSPGEDSFERHETFLDNQLADKLNSTPMAASQSSKSSTLEQYSTSPSKKLIFNKKSSISILTNNALSKAAVADTTVGDITQETVYSESFSNSPEDANVSFKNSL